MATQPKKNDAEPIVIERQKSSSSERSTRLGVIQDSEGHFLRAMRRFSDAMDRGLSTYIDERDSSVAEKGDTAFADIIPNMARGFQAAIEAIAPLPVDLANALYPERARELVEDGIKTASDVINMDRLTITRKETENSTKVEVKAES